MDQDGVYFYAVNVQLSRTYKACAHYIIAGYVYRLKLITTSLLFSLLYVFVHLSMYVCSCFGIKCICRRAFRYMSFVHFDASHFSETQQFNLCYLLFVWKSFLIYTVCSENVTYAIENITWRIISPG